MMKCPRHDDGLCLYALGKIFRLKYGHAIDIAILAIDKEFVTQNTFLLKAQFLVHTHRALIFTVDNQG